MLCEQCKKRNVSVFISEGGIEESKTHSLCAECAAKFRSEPKVQISLKEVEAKKPTPQKSKLYCKACGYTAESFEKSGRALLGCPECYTYFADEIEGTRKWVWGELSYSGRLPLSERREKERLEKISKIREKLSEAVESENFEEALVLRDMIRSINATQAN